MQKYYCHSVPRQNPATKEGSNQRRMAIVLREGDLVEYPSDSGKQCVNLDPRPLRPEYSFGYIDGLREGHVYTRRQLQDLGGHLAAQRGISGRSDIGADAIIVTGTREDGLGVDHFHFLVYAAESYKGANAMVLSFCRKYPIRVLRSSKYQSPFNVIDPENTLTTKAAFYRYDGLYRISA